MNLKNYVMDTTFKDIAKITDKVRNKSIIKSCPPLIVLPEAPSTGPGTQHVLINVLSQGLRRE